jgi:hypothetical protein
MCVQPSPAAKLAGSYTQALRNHDTRIKTIRLVDQYEGKDFASYQYQIDVSDPGLHNFSAGNSMQWINMKMKSDNQWYVESMTNYPQNLFDAPGEKWNQ